MYFGQKEPRKSTDRKNNFFLNELFFPFVIGFSFKLNFVKAKPWLEVR